MYKAYYVINDINEPINAIQVRKIFQKPLSGSFALGDKLLMKNFRLAKKLTKYLINILTPYIDVKMRLSFIDVNTKIQTKD